MSVLLPLNRDSGRDTPLLVKLGLMLLDSQSARELQEPRVAGPGVTAVGGTDSSRRKHPPFFLLPFSFPSSKETGFQWPNRQEGMEGWGGLWDSRQ